MKRLTKKELRKKIALIVARMRAEATPFEDASEEAKAKRRETGRLNKAWFFKTYFPHYFELGFSEMHYDLMGFADIKEMPVLIAGFRESAKSTVLTFGDFIHKVCYKSRHFIILISEIEEHAADLLEFVKLEFEENERLRMDFGELLRPGQEKKDFIANETRLKARGHRQRIRGLRYRQYRPDHVAVDDYEDEKSVRNPRIIRDKMNWLKRSVIGALGKGFSFVMVGQLLARKCVLAQMMAEEKDGEPVYISRVYRIYKDDGTPAWPEMWPVARIEHWRRIMGSTAFQAEMMQDPREEEGPFQVIYYYTVEELAGRNLEVVGFIDGSVGSGESNDFKAIVIVARDRATGDMFCLYAFIKRCSISRMVTGAYGAEEDYKPRIIGLETNSFQKLLLNDFDRGAEERGYHLPLKEVVHTTNKESRIISGCESVVERGKLKFRKGHSDQDLLVDQLQSLLSPTVEDDGPDALEGAVSLLNRSARKAEIATARRRKAPAMMEAY